MSQTLAAAQASVDKKQAPPHVPKMMFLADKLPYAVEWLEFENLEFSEQWDPIIASIGDEIWLALPKSWH